jgi:hypothetical protein
MYKLCLHIFPSLERHHDNSDDDKDYDADCPENDDDKEQLRKNNTRKLKQRTDLILVCVKFVLTITLLLEN